jgi:drug/metabolite transporter (DMT)-like permease
VNVAPSTTTPPKTPSSTAVQWALVITPGLIWGSSYLFIAEGLTSIRPLGITFVRTVIGFATLGLIPAARRPIPRTEWPLVALLGLIWLAFPMTMFPFAQQHISSALTGLLNAATPLFVALVSAGLARRVPSKPVAGALIVGLVGAIFIAAPSLGEGRNTGRGIGLVLIALTCYGFAINLARPLQQRNGALPVIWRAVGTAAILTAPTGLPAVADASWTINSALAMLALGALGTGAANVMVATAAGRTNATAASAMGFIIPAVALLLGVLVRDEHVQLLSIFGAFTCVVGAALLARTSTPKLDARTPNERKRTNQCTSPR